jgi:tetratricopeptide (TPR) repeat protein
MPAGTDPMVAGLTGKQDTPKLSPELNDEVNTLEATVHSNSAICYLKLDKPSQALEAAESATKILPTYAKAWLRKAEAHLHLKSTDKASEALNQAESHANSDQAILKAITTMRAEVKKEERVQNQKQAKAFGNIFQRLQKEESGSEHKS